MPLQSITALFDWWEGVAGCNAKSRKVYDPKNLVDYHGCLINVTRYDQEGEIVIHGQKFIKRLAERQAKREKAKCQQ